ncbi:MmcQ/YjbR family DNA-binding protein [Luteimonas sp. RD2P54]|uniref:MmcQ/YjbR family DNA-binding protein n=1 Tax=Luteimonas endophytica TaxID=3042023 RepID=A0ABT6J9N0_9GAMM|nr:MmcQ/YjbR family DNA-binding protein [Luteimonas endophytica]MDH5823297.1 MmcQ/YjbR family DNA-binding protein [Luteimonas endophytica]
MDTAQLKAFCAALPGAEDHEHAAPANILVYSVGGRRFAHFKTSAPERWRFSLKVAPERFLELTDMPGIRPARWLGRHRWITIVDVAAFPGDQLRALVEWSWRHALDRLSKARREAILGTGAAPRTS